MLLQSYRKMAKTPRLLSDGSFASYRGYLLLNNTVFPFSLGTRSVHHVHKQSARKARYERLARRVGCGRIGSPNEKGKNALIKTKKRCFTNKFVLFLPRMFVHIQRSFVGNCLCLLFFTRSDCSQHKGYGQCWQDQHDYIRYNHLYVHTQTARKAQYSPQEYHRRKAGTCQCPKYPCYQTPYFLGFVAHLYPLLLCFMVLLYNNEDGVRIPNILRAITNYQATPVLIGGLINPNHISILREKNLNETAGAAISYGLFAQLLWPTHKIQSLPVY